MNTAPYSSTPLAPGSITQCVMRDVEGMAQYVPLEEVHPSLRVDGEPLWVGTWTSEVFGIGPSKTHKLTICEPQKVTRTRLALN
jgi:hypothetical protein